MRQARLPFIICVIALLTAFAVAACDRGGPDEGETPMPGTPYTEALLGTWQRVNPLYAHANPVDADLSRLVFSGLTYIGTDGTIQPDLAREWTISDDGLTYRFLLRDGLQWQDGTPLTSDDVRFTIEQIVSDSYRGDPTLAELWRPTTVTTPDNLTVVIELERPYAPFLARATTVGILPEHLLAGMTGDQLYEADYNALPVGSGPYRLDTLTVNEGMLTAYDNYHFGAPTIREMRLAFVPDARSALQLGAGLDGLFFSNPASQEVEAVTGAREDMEQEALVEGAFHVLYLNNNTVLFSQPEVRRAISLAIDRDAIVEDAMGGYGVASSSPITPETWAYAEDVDEPSQDIETAESLLQSVGFERSEATGILTREGAELAFTIRTDSDPVRMAVAESIAAQLREVGMRVNVASTSFSVLRDDFLRTRRYEAALATWEQTPDPDAYGAWHSSQTGPEGTNFANAGDRRIDALLEEARTATRQASRLDFYHQFQDVWQDAMPSVIVAYPTSLYLGAPGIDRELPDVLFDSSDRFTDVLEWSR